jgi:hypothetical protein
VVNADGTVARHKGLASTANTNGGAGLYELTFNRDVAGCAALATIGTSDATIAPAAQIAVNYIVGLPAHLRVRTFDSAGTLTNEPFHVAVLC